MGRCNKTWNGKDIPIHFSVCFVTAICNPFLALLIVISKAIYDVIRPNNHFCWKDVLFGIAGIICGTLIHLIILLFIC